MSAQCPGSGLAYSAPSSTTHGTCPHCGARVELVPVNPAIVKWPARFNLRGHMEAQRGAD